eukprot:s1891_g8.t1
MNVVLTTTSPDQQPEPKRRRLAGKFHPEQLYIDPVDSGSAAPNAIQSSVPDSVPVSSDASAQYRSILQLAEQCAPRVGKIVFQEGPLIDAIRKLYDDKEIKAIDVCRGINRMRVCPISGRGFAPFRRSIGKRRSDLEPFADAQWEEWESLSQRQRIRSLAVPAKLLVTIFASNKRLPERTCEEPNSKCARTDEDASTPEVPVGNPPDSEISTSPEQSIPLSSSDSNTQLPVTEKKSTDHGPLFRQLHPHTQNLIKKIHHNLGHPDSRVIQMALRRNGWSEEDVRGSADFCCPTCHEHQQPKVARPGKLKVPTDFHHISFDGAAWKDDQGHTYGFYHFIDTATNFHVAVPYQQRTTESLIEAFSSGWIRWAGPPKSMMFDSATEANSEVFAQFLQRHAIQSYVIPTDAHWQLGRAERHGAILMHMISKYHSDQPIQSFQDFEQCLIHLCNAKNSMSRHEGYTPELRVLGKMRSLPGNCTDLYLDSASYFGLNEQSPEGSRFQANMARREAARIAFIKAEHSTELRRALHARSRPERMVFQVGDFVMYWKSGKGVEPGAWHGPAKVLMLEGRNLVWISHMTRLFRCAPEHVRKLSSDEEQSLTDADRVLFQLPERSGSGVFQFRELSQQSHPPEMSPSPEHPITPLNRPTNPEPEVFVAPPDANNEDNITPDEQQNGSEA